MRTIPYKEDLTVEFKSDLKRYPDNDLSEMGTLSDGNPTI